MTPAKRVAGPKKRTVVSETLADGRMIEMILAAGDRTTQLAVYENGKVAVVDSLDTADEQFVPVPAANNLIKHSAVLFAESAEPYGSAAELVRDIKEYLYRYVDLSDAFRHLAAHYVLLTWVYDAFNELPYLRVRGDYGSGKSRALTVIGSVCYKAFFASGASTVSPIFHTLDTFKGTLVVDEADFRFSDEKSELVKIFNNGNVRGFPVLRTAIRQQKEFDPRAFIVYGPKIVAMRRSFEDQALESRFLTEEMGQRPMRADIPINLPDSQKQEALKLRNRLLDFRFRNVARYAANAALVDPSLSPRMNQILVPLLSIIEDEASREEVRRAVQFFDRRLEADRSETAEAGLLGILWKEFRDKSGGSVTVAHVARQFATSFGAEYERPVTNRFVGGVLRKRLRLLTLKSHGVYVIPISEKEKIRELGIRYGAITREMDTATG